MSRVSLILPTTPGDPRPDGLVAPMRQALEAAGHVVEAIVANGAGMTPGGTGDGATQVVADHPGLASSAMAGLDRAEGDVIVVVDPVMGYDAESVLSVVAALVEGRADVVVGSRWPAGTTGLRGVLGRVARPFTGSTDPLSGLVGLTRGALDEAIGRMRPVGSKISLEMLAKVHGRRHDVRATRTRDARRRRRAWPTCGTSSDWPIIATATPRA